MQMIHLPAGHISLSTLTVDDYGNLVQIGSAFAIAIGTFTSAAFDIEVSVNTFFHATRLS